MSGRRFRLGACFFVPLLGALLLYAQSPDIQTAPSIKGKAEDVLLDVVVRDKKGRLVTTLKPEDFRVLDNGVPQKIDGFRLLQGNEAITGNGSRTQLDPQRQVRLITMVFQSASPNARRLAHAASEDLLKDELPQNVYIAVMKIDFKLQIVQGYTNDVAVLRKAIDAVAKGSSTDFTRDAQLLKEQLEKQLGPDFDDPLLAQSHQPAGPWTANAIILALYFKTKRATEQVSGRQYISALLDLIEEQYRLPGRKTVLYFSEGGFKIPEGGDQWVRNLISLANRSNVSLYAIDTTGLAIADPNRDVERQLHRAGSGEGVMSGPAAGSVDFALEITRSNPQMNLRYIAESTGGALIANMNDFRDPLRKVVEDLETHYEISYAPEIKNHDGSFHNITVEIKEKGFHVQSRSGYFALPPSLGAATELKAYEVPLLTALSSVELPMDFAFHSAAMYFRNRKNQPEYVLAIDVPFSGITFASKGQSFEARFSYETLVKNESGVVVRKFQNEVPLLVSADKLEALKKSHYIYTDHFDLPPGRYTVETAVLDSEKENRLSARKVSLTVPPAQSSFDLSSVTFIRNISEMQPAAEGDLAADTPLHVGSRTISPDLDPVINRETDKNLSFYLAAYPDSTSNLPLSLAMELSQGGAILGGTKLELGKPDEQGRIQYIGSIPASALRPGDYTVRFVLQQGTQAAQQAAFFTVQ
jgi:VWFA-related protein